jgi:hypothetical protein
LRRRVPVSERSFFVSRVPFAVGLLAAAGLLAAGHAHAHAVAGVRVFPVTLTLDDPGVADEATLPQVVWQPGPNGSVTDQLQWEFDKTITPTTALIYNQGYDRVTQPGTKTQTGFENAVITGKWQAYVNAAHEFILSLGVQQEFSGNSHTVNVGGDATGSTSPVLYFGKGLGDLPIGNLRPLAITGELIYSIPDVRLNSTGDNNGQFNTIFGGLSLQYSIPYLESQVKNHGLPDFVSRLIPLVEFNYESPASAPTDGTPMTLQGSAGVIYMADSYQVGLEALFPLNKADGPHVGAILQVHFFLDDIFPNSIGKPLFH